MRALLQHVLKPTPTVPFNPYLGKQDQRTIRVKALSGVRLGLGLVGGFLILATLFAGVQNLPNGMPRFGANGIWVAWTYVCFALIVMFWPVERWAPLVAGYACFPALYKGIVAVLAPGHHTFNSSHNVSRVEGMEIIFGALAIILVTWRFVGYRPSSTTFVDRVALTFFVLAAAMQLATPGQRVPVLLIAGYAGLVIAWCAYRWKWVRRTPASNAAS
jgi:hypothetical protein